MSDGDSGATVELIAPEAPTDRRDPVALVELVNRVIDRGVVVSGEVLISVAGVDLLYLGLRLLLASPDRLEGGGARSEAESGARSELDESAGVDADVRETESVGGPR